MDIYPYRFQPIYVEKIWGGRSLERLFGRTLPAGKKIGESWELSDLPEGTSVVSNGPLAGTPLTELTKQLGGDLLGRTAPMPDGRFPLLLKLLDANDILSLQVHPDAEAVAEIGPEAALKTECWYTLDSRDGYIYKGVEAGTTPEQFHSAIENDTVGDLVRRVDLSAGDFHYLPAGTVHALGPGLVVAEVQTPSDTTYRVTDWGRGREIHVERSMQCIHFEPARDESPGAAGETLLVTDFFTVAKRTVKGGDDLRPTTLSEGRCIAIMMLSGTTQIVAGAGPPLVVPAKAGDTVLLPAGLRWAEATAHEDFSYLEITLPEKP